MINKRSTKRLKLSSNELINGTKNFTINGATNKKELSSPVSSNYLVKYSPKTKNDLCIDKKKLATIENWFNLVFINKQTINRTLVLYGPTGCCKTSTINCLAKYYDVTLFDFEEETQTFSKTSEERQFTQHVGKQLDQIQLFVTRANSFLSKKDRERRKAIVIKDIPSTFLSNANQFHQFLKDYLTTFKKGAPIIFIITINENFTQHSFKNLFPQELHQTLGLHLIELNGVIKKQIRTVLERINISGLVSKKDLELIIESSNGDIRAAINAMEFLVESDKEFNRLQNYTEPLNKSTELNNRLIAVKDSLPSFFHMLGKIMYCKRDGDEILSTKKSTAKFCPDEFDLNDDFGKNLKINCPRRKLKENPERLADFIDCTGDRLAIFIHDSYLHFVDDNFENATNIITNLSFVDSSFSENAWQFSEQDDFMKLLAIRGTMFNLNTSKVPIKTKRQFRAFNRPKHYEILNDIDKFRNRFEEHSKMVKNHEFRSKDELMEILYYKDKNLFAKLTRI